jgi:outer membrane receptor protein involved in Fe transport
MAVALAIQASLMQLANAQQAPQSTQKAGADNLDQVVITGSRIVRRDYVANSPIQTIDASALENKAAVTIEDTLNKMPQFVPAATGYTQVSNGELINTGSTATAGAATLSLRGLGPNRNLVLIDGYRAVPVNATMAVDINTIPAAAIDRVEVITGGASSVYGADAVSGVVNFILKKNFQGINLDGQYGAMQNGHAGESRFSALVGANSSDGRGNLMVGMEYDKRDAVEWKDVSFYRGSMSDPTTNGTISIVTDPYVTFAAANAPGGSVVDSIFNRAPANTVLRNSVGQIGGNVYLNQDGTVYTGASIFNTVSPAGKGATAGLYRYNGPLTQGDFVFRKIDGQGFLQEYIPHHKANVPLERYSLFARAEYELTDSVSLYLQSNNVEAKTVQLWQVSPATGGWSSTIPHGTDVYAPSLASGGTTLTAYRAGGQFGLNCPATGGCTNSQAFPVSPELGRLLDSRTTPNTPFNLSYSLDFPYYGLGVPRTVDTTQRTDQFQIGLKGKVSALDGSWDITASHGTSTLGLLLQGYAALSQVRAVIQSPNFGTGFFAQANAGPPGNGFAGGVAKCTSGIPVFRPHDQVSQDCLDAMIVQLQHQSKMVQDDFQANFQGHLANLPTGEVRFAVGTEYRKNDYRYIFDFLNTQTSFLDLGLGTFPANSTTGSTSVKEYYGELSVPVVKELPLIQHLNLELGYRWSDYKYQGGISTYKALADWGVTNALRFRGGYQAATRAPNIAEMFQAQSQTWSAAAPGDPCGLNTVASYGVNPAFNPGNYANARALCTKLMGTGAGQTFYGPGAIQPNGNAGLWFVNAVGNPNVNPEDATTYTAGLVFQPRWQHPLLAGFSSTIDWYRIVIKGMIAPEPGNAVYQACLSPGSNPTFDVSNEACQRIIRNPSTGTMTATNVSYINSGTSKLSGVDVTLDWKADVADMGLKSIRGNFGLNVVVSTLLQLETQATPTSPVIDWVGSLGPSAGTSLNRGAYRYRLFTTFNYGAGPFIANLRWRHLPTAKSELQATSTVPVTVMGAESNYDVFDFSGAWNMNDTVQLRVGIDNLFNTPPVITGRRAAGDPQPTSGAGVTEVGFYDVLGRQIYAGFKAKF